jgi:ankyrin repeat protein
MLKDVDVDEPDDHGRTALMKAFATGNLRATLFLIALGAHVNQADRDGKTPIMHAAENNQASIVDLFDSNQQAQAEMAALRVKYSGSHQGDGLGAIKGTVIKFEMPKLNLRLTDKRGQTAAVIAILKGHLGVANTLSRPGWDGRPDAFDDGQGNSVLHLAAATGNVRVIRHFRRFNVDYWAYYLSLSDPLNSYAWLCCRHGAINEEGKEPWMIAAEKGHLEVTKHLLPAPSLEDLTRKDKAGKTGLDLAAANHHKEVVAYLRQIQGDLKKKAEPPDKK